MKRTIDILWDLFVWALLITVIVFCLVGGASFGEVVDVPKVRDVGDRKLFGEIRSRLPRIFLGIDVDRTYKVRPDGMQPDPQNHVSTAHEFTHALNSVLRHRHRSKVVCYIPGGRVLVVGRLNGLTEPGNPLDETCAYTCGAIVCLERGLPKRRAIDSLKRADPYLKRCFRLARNGRQRGYADADELETFLNGLQQFQEQLTFRCLTPDPEEN